MWSRIFQDRYLGDVNLLILIIIFFLSISLISTFVTFFLENSKLKFLLAFPIYKR